MTPDKTHAGEEEVKDAISDVSGEASEEQKKCEHEFLAQKDILHKKNLFGSEEMITCIVFCRKCGKLTGSSRIRF